MSWAQKLLHDFRFIDGRLQMPPSKFAEWKRTGAQLSGHGRQVRLAELKDLRVKFIGSGGAWGAEAVRQLAELIDALGSDGGSVANLTVCIGGLSRDDDELAPHSSPEPL